MKELKLNNKITLLLGILIIFFSISSCKKETVEAGKPKQVAPLSNEIERINDINYFKKIVLGAQANMEAGGCLNLKNGYVYDVIPAGEVQGEIDLVLMNGASSFMNLISPASSRFSSWGTTTETRKYIYDRWWIRNLGTIISLPNPSAEEVQLFEEAGSVQDILTAYQSITENITKRDGYSKTNDGPASNVRKVDVGNIVLFYSEVRHLVAIMKVDSVVEGTDGKMQLQIKSGTF